MDDGKILLCLPPFFLAYVKCFPVAFSSSWMPLGDHKVLSSCLFMKWTEKAKRKRQTFNEVYWIFNSFTPLQESFPIDRVSLPTGSQQLGKRSTMKWWNYLDISENSYNTTGSFTCLSRLMRQMVWEMANEIPFIRDWGRMKYKSALWLKWRFYGNFELFLFSGNNYALGICVMGMLGRLVFYAQNYTNWMIERQPVRNERDHCWRLI